MPPPEAKRRKTENATKILIRPFKSPLKSTQNPTNQNRDLGLSVDTAGNASRKPRPANDGKQDADSEGETVSRGMNETQNATLVNPAYPSSTPAKPTVVKTPEAEEILRLNRQLEAQIRSIREEIDTLSQATKIIKSGRDEELAGLVSKWKAVSRAAAEELFASAKDKVNRIGGVGSWRDMEKKRLEWRTQWDEERPQAEAGSEVEDETEQEEQDGKEDDAFTMDMMLRSLNIELDVIGYDRKEQRWT